jgi:xanthine dehydrogenase YagS FAD-binding subunit
LKKGGTTCFAVNGENQYHAIFGGGPCFCVHPSDLAVALAALEAQVMIAGPSGSRALRLADFFVGPKKAVDKENVLLPGEILTEVHLPPAGGKIKSSFRKIRARGSWDFALASAATLLELDGEIVRTARIVLGGVAPYPWHVEAAEKVLTAKKLDAALALAAAEAAVKGATPLKGNAYKVEMAKGAVEESLGSLM